MTRSNIQIEDVTRTGYGDPDDGFWNLYEEGEDEPCATVEKVPAYRLRIKGSGMPGRLFSTLDDARCWLEDYRDHLSR